MEQLIDEIDEQKVCFECEIIKSDETHCKECD